MSDTLEAIVPLVALRDRVEGLVRHHVLGLSPFKVYDDDGGAPRLRGFSLTPDPADQRVSLASTATCVRSLMRAPTRVRLRFDLGGIAQTIIARWEEATILTQGLGHMNPFTLGQLGGVLTAVGFSPDDPFVRECVEKLEQASAGGGLSLQIGENGDELPPNAYVTYWALTSLDALKAEVSTAAVAWSRSLFHRQLALLSAGDFEEGDAFQLGYHFLIQQAFASEALRPTEVLHAFRILESNQLARGEWEKKEPLFPWKQTSAYPFSFELANSLLIEFANNREPLAEFAPALIRMLEWAERNVTWDSDAQAPLWRSGHRTFQKKAESWATAEVYSFLHLFSEYLDWRLNSELVARYHGRAPTGAPNPDVFGKRYQPEVRSSSDRQNSPLLGEILTSQMLDPLGESTGASFTIATNDEPQRRVRSAILFGPPGTGKSSYVKAVADYLGWPLITLDPSDFATQGFALMPHRVTEIFSDLREARDVVVFFDEMEEFMKERRSPNGTDATFEQRLLTTALLPKLQDLHDQARCLFFVATNHFESLDPAAKRFGRFDLILEVLPPCLDETIRQITDGLLSAYSTAEDVHHPPNREEDRETVRRTVEDVVRGLPANKTSTLTWATYGEVGALVGKVLRGLDGDDLIGDPANLIRALGAAFDGLSSAIVAKEWSKTFKFNRREAFP